MAFNAQYIATRFLTEGFSIPLNLRNNELAGFINSMVAKMSSMDLDLDSGDTQHIADVATAIDEVMHLEEFVPAMDMIEQLANVSATTINSALRTINLDITPTVDALYKRMLELKDDELRSGDYTTLVSEAAEREAITFAQFDWGRSITAGRKTMIDALLESVGSDYGKQMGRGAMNLINTALLMRDGVKVITIADSKAVIDALMPHMESFGPIFTRDSLMVLMDPRTHLANLIKSFTQTIGKAPVDVIRGIQDLITRLETVVRILNTEAIELPLNPDVRTALIENFKTISLNIALLEMAIISLHDVQFAGKLILDINTVNGEIYPAYLQGGGSPEEIRDFLRVLYKDPETSFPTFGLPMDTVVKSRDQVTELSALRNVKAEANRKLIIGRAINVATKQTLTEYYATLTNEGLSPEELQKRYQQHGVAMIAVMSMVAGEQTCVEDAFYTYLIRLHYGDSLVSTLYHRMGRAYVELAKSMADIEASKIELANAEVVADFVAEYLLKTFCE